MCIVTTACAPKNLLRIQKVLPTPYPHWVGDGFHVHSVFGSAAFTPDISPWLMFDYAAPKYFPPSTHPKGVGQHPHRGFETITIAYQGAVEHSDSVGNNDVIGPGDVQWMTAGRGIIHEEFHSTDFSKNGGTFEMCQIWLNLPAKDKMVAPKYQPLLSTGIPIVSLDEDNKVKVRVIAGTVQDVKGPAETFTPVELWDIMIDSPEKSAELPIPAGHNVVVFVRKGAVEIGSANGHKTKLGPQGVALLGSDGDDEQENLLQLVAKDAKTSIIVLGGEPIREPISARGPFVMNTFEEIMQANKDYRSGKMGR